MLTKQTFIYPEEDPGVDMCHGGWDGHLGGNSHSHGFFSNGSFGGRKMGLSFPSPLLKQELTRKHPVGS